MQEILRDIRAMERSTASVVKEEIITTLLATRTDIDYGRLQPPEWQRGSIYFHSLQDTFFAARVLTPSDHSMIRMAQACFAKDLTLYIEKFPETEDPTMKKLFQTIFEVGTSVFWDQDRTFIETFDQIYSALDEQIIKPWAEAVK